MATLALQALLVAWCFLVPGCALASCTDARWSLGLRLAVGFTVGVLVVPLASFAGAWLLGTNVNPPLVCSVAGIITASAGSTTLVRRRRERRRKSP